MANDPAKLPVRIRTRTAASSKGQRLIADADHAGADHAGADHAGVNHSGRRKRQPNAGSMKKGETRNPHGRPKGAKGTKTMVSKVLSQKTLIKDGGATRKVTLFQALLLKEVQAAFNGDWRARKTVLELGRWALPEGSPGSTAQASSGSGATDQAILDWFADEVRAGTREEQV